MIDYQLKGALILLFAGRDKHVINKTLVEVLKSGKERCDLAWALLGEEGIAVHIVGSVGDILAEIADNGEVYTGTDHDLKNRVLEMEQWDSGDHIYGMRGELIKDLRRDGLLMPEREYQDMVDKEAADEARFQASRDAALDAAE